MLPHYIILSVFSVLLSQGNIVVAIPEANAFASGSERIGGSQPTTTISTRTDALEARSEPIILRSESTALVVRHPRDFDLISKRIPWYSVIGLVSSCISICKFGKETVEWVKETKLGKDLAKATSSQVNTIAECVWKKSPKLKLADIELGLTGGGGSGGQLAMRRKSI